MFLPRVLEAFPASRLVENLKAKQKGFSLVELLVVVVIIGVIAAIAVPLFLNQREKAEEASAKSTLTTLAKALATAQGTGGTATVSGETLQVTDGSGGITTIPLGGAYISNATNLARGEWCATLDGVGVGAGETQASSNSDCSDIPVVREGLMLHLDAGNPESYSGSGTVVNDLSGNGNNSTLINGTTYSNENGGGLGFLMESMTLSVCLFR